MRGSLIASILSEDSSPNPRVPAGVSALIDVAAANVGLEVLVTPVTGTGVGPVAVAAGGVLATVGQGGP